ncbi:MAG: acyl-ACP desaturase [Planctomycetes bacterium]|nr:acyl-ACP desaturase [Planctomycetota bacterium]
MQDEAWALSTLSPGGVLLTELTGVVPSELERAFWRLYRDFFDRAEKKRRWSLRDDIPWDQCNPDVDPAIADVVESFCAVELYLPDYTSKILPVVRPSRGRTWFYANWGYEESKHSLALGDWLLASGSRTDEQMTDLENMVFEREWNLPHDSQLGMLVYAMTQELATFLAYRNLRQRLEERGDDPALNKLLRLVSVDERAHYDFFRQGVSLFLQHDRDETLEQMRRVMHNFAMPAINELAEGRRRVAAVNALEIMSEDIYYRDVYLPILAELDVDRAEMRSRIPVRKSAPTA